MHTYAKKKCIPNPQTKFSAGRPKPHELWKSVNLTYKTVTKRKRRNNGNEKQLRFKWVAQEQEVKVLKVKACRVQTLLTCQWLLGDWILIRTRIKIILKNRKFKRKRKQKRKRGSLREGREAPPRRCPHPFRSCFRFRFNFRFFKFLFLSVYVLIFNRPVFEAYGRVRTHLDLVGTVQPRSDTCECLWRC